MLPPSSQAVFETEGTAEQKKKRLLLVSFHFPPDSAIGARRWEKIAKYAAQRGWGLDVISKSEPLNSDVRERLSKALPGGVRIFHLPFSELAVQRWEQSALDLVNRFRGGSSSSSTSVNSPVISPDKSAATDSSQTGGVAVVNYQKDVGLVSQLKSVVKNCLRFTARGYWASLEYARYIPWMNEAVKAGSSIVNVGIHKAVISSGPPHMMHEVARRISVETGLSYIMDMRDPWSLNEQIVDHLDSPVWYKIADKLERNCVARASLIVANTDAARLEIQAKYPARRTDIITAMNGFDDDPLPVPERSDAFVIAHAGTIYLDRNPRALFDAAALVIPEMGLTPETFRIEFIGSFTDADYPIRSVVESIGISEFVRVGGARPHAEAMKFLSNASMLLTMSGSNRSAIPAKTFEYMRFDAWILALSESESATAQLLSATSADIADPSEIAAIADILRARITDHRRGVVPVAIAKNRTFSREAQAAILLDAIQARVN